MHNHSSHDHGHSHGKNAPRNVLLIAVVVAFCFAGIEAFSGWWAGSLALLSDAGHMGADSLSLAIAAFAAWMAARPPTQAHSYGLGRAEVISAWGSSIFILVVAVVIVIEAVRRLHEPQAVAGSTVMVVASIGVLVNIFIAWLLTRGERTLNTKAATLHVLGDLLGSIAALISGAVIHFTHWTPIDPILSIFISLLILISSLNIIRESMQVLMEGVPAHINLQTVNDEISAVEHVTNVHDLHIWTLSSGMIVLSAHVEITEMQYWEPTLTILRKLLANHYHIEHITLQPEISSDVLCKGSDTNPSSGNNNRYCISH